MQRRIAMDEIVVASAKNPCHKCKRLHIVLGFGMGRTGFPPDEARCATRSKATRRRL